MTNTIAQRVLANRKTQTAAVQVPRFTSPEQYINFMIEVIDLFDVRAITDYAKKMDAEHGTDVYRAIKKVEAATLTLSDELADLAEEIS